MKTQQKCRLSYPNDVGVLSLVVIVVGGGVDVVVDATDAIVVAVLVLLIFVVVVVVVGELNFEKRRHSTFARRISSSAVDPINNNYNPDC